MGRHSNRYKYWYDNKYSLEEMKEYFGSGWHELLENAFEWVSYLPNAEIWSAKRCYARLHMYGRAEDEGIEHAVEGILWKVEGLSAKVCEHCGRHGQKRKELKTMYCLCNDCYIVFLNKSDDPMSMFREGHEGRFR